MTAPRQVLPGTIYLVTRRCSQRHFLLRPSKSTTQLVLFVLAVAAERYGIQLHAYCVMSNHVHLVLTDPQARLPAFNQFLDAFVARAVNALLGRWETFWGPNSYSAVKLVSPSDVADKVAYVLANPVAAGLVRLPQLWPGAWSDPERFGAEPAPVTRPTHFFAKNGSLPPAAALQLTVPAGFGSAAEFRTRVMAALQERVAVARRRVGGRFLGIARILRTNPRSGPRTVEPRRQLNPRIAARRRSQRIGALAERLDFLRKYRTALAERRAGKCDVVFPAGTYLLRVAHGVRCAGFT